jgi:uncharacterized protein
MQRSGFTDLPLHGGKAPRWLFKRMVGLAGGIIDVLQYEFGSEELIKRVSDPFWSQALSCVLGYDWHSSGTTTVTCGALKEAIQPEKHGLAIAGGKGKRSRNTLQEIKMYSELFNIPCSTVDTLQYASRMAAKIDTAAIQDGYNLYHHVFIFSEKGQWGVIQQGMNNETSYARRYHWRSNDLTSFISEPHEGIIGDMIHSQVLNMAAKESKRAQKTSVDLINDNPTHLKQTWSTLTLPSGQMTLDGSMILEKCNEVKSFKMPISVNWNRLKEIYEFQPRDYEEFLSCKGVGPSTVRALALISDLVYGSEPSWHDPVKYSFTVGGKDGVPFPVDTKAMDESIELIQNAIQQTKLGSKEQLKAIQRLKRFVQPVCE